ncbi:hypothetical protein [uncultured Mailhella sp.]|uniref:hypothetical protein n=1 Tax=uncultured Mailhella sp. TaxID=1981031 RepID=UPI003207DED0
MARFRKNAEKSLAQKNKNGKSLSPARAEGMMKSCNALNELRFTRAQFERKSSGTNDTKREGRSLPLRSVT